MAGARMNDKTGRPIRVWALLGPHRGDNNQILALAEALELGFEEKPLNFNQLRRLQPALLGASFASLDSASRRLLEGEPPDLTISTGHRSVPAVLELKRRSGGRMHAVHLGYPRIAPRHFDLVVPTPEYPITDAPNVLRIPFALSPHSPPAVVSPAEQSKFDALPQPRRLFVVGGPTLYWQLPTDTMRAAVSRLLADSRNDGGSLLLVSSPRTPAPLIEALESELRPSTLPILIVPASGPPSYRSMLEAADMIFVTADSVAMVADSVMTRKPVGIVPIEKSALGRVATALNDTVRRGKRLFPRDLRFFWEALKEQGFGGTIAAPRASNPPDYSAMVAERVRQLLAQPAQPATGDRDNGQ